MQKFLKQDTKAIISHMMAHTQESEWWEKVAQTQNSHILKTEVVVYSPVRFSYSCWMVFGSFLKILSRRDTKFPPGALWTTDLSSFCPFWKKFQPGADGEVLCLGTLLRPWGANSWLLRVCIFGVHSHQAAALWKTACLCHQQPHCQAPPGGHGHPDKGGKSPCRPGEVVASSWPVTSMELGLTLWKLVYKFQP